MCRIALDSVRFRGEEWGIIASMGQGLFDPSQYGVRATGSSTGLLHGCRSTYSLEDDGLFLGELYVVGSWTRDALTFDGFGSREVYASEDLFDLPLPIEFDGCLLLARGRRPENFWPYPVPPHYYEHVLECRLSAGRLIEVIDHSALFEELYLVFRHEWEDLPGVEGFPLWAILRQPDTVLRGEVPPYAAPELGIEGTRAETERECRAWLEAEGSETIDQRVAREERTAREQFEEIREHGAECTSCGRPGDAETGFRLHEGDPWCVICRRCGCSQPIPKRAAP